ncbi:ester hydrolase C11orf54 homolog [Pogonomyrmex barbatus]|uniref:Ester hydrolase C11orf54 homolog n=1 Tax=Pogonomyrmex barbatus TaxID=144034 RepID=A0A6I9VVW9_9HYME|nr:ester hydrolase C11orf54 homolog [Pogonomyrmex barbatus]
MENEYDGNVSSHEQNNKQNDINLSRLINETWNLDVPTLEEAVPVLNRGLRNQFEQVEVAITQCPNLTSYFCLAASGLCGHVEIIEVGNHKHVYYPSKKKEGFMEYSISCK